MRLDNYEIDLLACLFIFVDELYYGKNPGVYDSWKKCNEQVDGYKNNYYKGYKTKKEAGDHYTN